MYKQTPNYTREGGSIPVTLTFAEALGVNVLLLPMGRGDDGAWTGTRDDVRGERRGYQLGAITNVLDPAVERLL